MYHANEEGFLDKIKTLQIDLNLCLLTHCLATLKIKILGYGLKLPLTRVMIGIP
jgi:hypothetical protein